MMFTINIEKECGCFKKSDFKNNQSFASKDDALIEAKLMESHMNQKFCQNHIFYTEETGNNFTIRVEDKPKESTGGCCGGGHSS